MLTITPSPSNQLAWETPLGIDVQVPLLYTVAENDPTLTFQDIDVTIMWGDGVQNFYTGTSYVQIARAISFAPGQYFIQVSAQNRRFPAPDTVRLSQIINVTLAAAPPLPTQYIYGPILPRDNGYPNDDQWSFNRGADLEILESNAKMLLSTAKGERINNPNYGTNLRQLIFSQDTAAAQASIQDEIITALATYEPRLKVISISVMQPNPADQTTLIVNIMLESLISQSQILLSLPFSAG